MVGTFCATCKVTGYVVTNFCLLRMVAFYELSPVTNCHSTSKIVSKMISVVGDQGIEYCGDQFSSD